jgi:hypothetical protein
VNDNRMITLEEMVQSDVLAHVKSIGSMYGSSQRTFDNGNE